MRSIFDNLINKGHPRSAKVKRNIFASFFIKGCNIGISLLLVPLTLHYINAAQYGMWLTLSSVVAWFSFFDIGFGNGLRNKFAEAIARDEHKLARIYLSTTYAVLTLIAAGLLVIIFVLFPLINWSDVLNAPAVATGQLSTIVLFTFSFFCIQFVLQLITTVVTANQETAKASLFNLLGNALALIIIFVLTKTTSGNLLYAALSLTAAPVFVLLIGNIWLYNGNYKMYAPALQYVRFRYMRSLTGLGIKFFLIQVSGIIIYSTDNLIITQLYGPKEVTPYNIAFKYFNTVLIVYSVILSPYWSTITEAYTRGDISWIKRSVNNLLKVSIIFCLLTALMLIFSQAVYKLWIGEEVHIPLHLSALMGLYFCLSLILQPFTTFVNGVGFLKVQLIQSIITASVNIPLAIYLSRSLHWGVAGIIAATIICFIPGLILTPVQYCKVVNGNAGGIWRK